MKAIFIILLTSGEGLKSGITYNILIFLPLGFPFAYFLLEQYFDSKEGLVLALAWFTVTVYCFIDIHLIWKNGLKPLSIWRIYIEDLNNEFREQNKENRKRERNMNLA
uniref:PrgI family protein n=1 Tax=Caenorhabditis tropicalis TaxID=1561998 RepID=A0A1I7UAI0_9PELO